MARGLLQYRHNPRGFMLLEVLVSLAILAVGITGLIMGLSNSLDRAKRMKEYSTAMFLAQHIIAGEEQVYAYSDEIATTERGTFYNEGLPGFEWESDVELDDETLEYLITVTVTWEHKGRELRYQLKELVPAHRETLDELGSNR